MLTKANFCSNFININTILFFNIILIFYNNFYIAILSNSPVGSFPRTTISFFLLSTCTDELLFTAKLTFLTNQVPFDNGKVELESNPIT